MSDDYVDLSGTWNDLLETNVDKLDGMSTCQK